MSVLDQLAKFPIILAISLSLLPHSALAQDQSSSTSSPCQVREGADGANPLILECSFFSEQDTVYVYTHGDQQAKNVEDGKLNFYDSFWLFDAQTDGTVQLIIEFQRVDDQVIADLYDDHTGDAHVDYKVVGDAILIVESAHPSVRVMAERDWWTAEGHVNHNLTVFVDGALWSAFGNELYSDYLSTDGKIDTEIEVFDTDSDGRPDLEVRHLPELTQSLPELARHSGLATQVMVNWHDSEDSASDSILWPFLGTEGSPLKDYNDSRAPIQVSWQEGRISAVGEFVASRGGESNCFIYSDIPLEENQTNMADFENPFCFYDLGEDQDGIPELQVRMEYWPAHSESILGGYVRHPLQWIRYSWEQDDEGSWDYGLGLAGRHPVTDTVELGPYKMQSIEYEEYPYWVTQSKWDAVTFVSQEGTYMPSSEGIYAAQVPMEVILWYLTGLSDRLPVIDLNDITRRGTRLEHSFDLRSQPSLYFSLVDSRLHLFQATRGLWKGEGQEMVHYQDANGDGYFDDWRYFEDQQLLRQLHLSNKHLVLGDLSETVVSLMKITDSTIAFDTLPPRDHEEWLALRQRLADHQHSIEPDDFAAMLSQFEGLTTRIEGAVLRDYRPTENGFRFALELQSGFRVLSDPEGLGVYLTAPGAYAVTHYGERFSVQSLTPPSLRVSKIGSSEPILELSWTSLEVMVENDGLEDVHDLPVSAFLIGPGGEHEVLTKTVGLLPGEGSQVVTWDWAPPVPGQWQARIEVGDEAKSGSGLPRQVLAKNTVLVEPASQVTLTWLVTLGGRVPVVIVLLFLAIALLATGLGIFWLQGLGPGIAEGDGDGTLAALGGDGWED